MKACLMRVNYDPKYTTPHSHKPYQSLHVRLSVTKDIYSNGAKIKKKDPVEENPKGKPLADRIPPIDDQSMSQDGKASHLKKLESKKNKGDWGSDSSEQYKSPYQKAHQTHEPVKSFMGQQKHINGKTKFSRSLHELPRDLDKSTAKNPFVRHQTVLERTVMLGKKSEHTIDVSSIPYDRSRTVFQSEGQKSRTSELIMLERKARVEADRAVRNKKVFTILGPYHGLRHALRRRGWVEKFQSIPSSKEKTHYKLKKSGPVLINDENDDPANQSENVTPLSNLKEQIRPWEEEKGFYALMSGAVKNNQPSFLFTVKSNDVDSRVIHNGQTVNHFGKSRSLTTKVGLCQALRNLCWYTDTDANLFYPQCFNLSDQGEKDMFIDEYRIIACVGILRHCLLTHDIDTCDKEQSSGSIASKDESEEASIPPAYEQFYKNNLEFGLNQCEIYLQDMEHSYIDEEKTVNIASPDEWSDFLAAYSKIVKMTTISNINLTKERLGSYSQILDRVRQVRPQYFLEGHSNWWILKPGAKSRGRGIQCMDNLQNVLNSIENEPSLVAQKYIERPLLVSNTKFDIRQWFLVTDWNPLTVWFYKDYYLRFCSQEYSLDTFHPSVHLSNNSIQKKYMKENADHAVLPSDKMWLQAEFEDYLRSKGNIEEYESKVIPGMKKAIICCLLCAQELVEERKNAFELFGADFVLTEDFHPWLLEINSSPSMAKSTRATSKLVDLVLEDTLKVVLDRRIDKNCDTGGFHLIHKQPLVHAPPPIDPLLAVCGKRIKAKPKNK